MARLLPTARSMTGQLPELQQLADGITRDYLLWHRVCPMDSPQAGILRVALAPGALTDALDDLALAYRSRIEQVPMGEGEVERLINRATERLDAALDVAPSDDAHELQADARDLANQPPVIRYVNMIVRDAHEAHASDIHLEATAEGLVARFRLDGVLSAAPEPPQSLQHAVISRIKLLAELDIAERRRPQDGRIRIRLESSELDVRVSTVPTIHGESVVLRLLDRGGRPVGLEELGMPADILGRIQAIATRPHGMLIATGPTGSGKTTTLYAALQARDASREKIVTVEDPIEYQLGGVTQVPVQRQTDVTFASALRAILRQDPDVLMIGEMRDHETAEIAVQAAMTGHFVFSTLHTNDATAAVPRLLDLGIPEYLINATLEAVLAQRLVRRVCGSCRVSYTPDPQQVAALCGKPVSARRLSRGAGCPACRGTGFQGRVGIFELMVVDDALREVLASRPSRWQLRESAMLHGMRPMREDAWAKVERGVTTVEEVLRVMQE